MQVAMSSTAELLFGVDLETAAAEDWFTGSPEAKQASLNLAKQLRQQGWKKINFCIAR